MTLKGCDISKWQATTPAGYDFYIIKASEGVGWKDPRLDQHFNQVKAWKKPYGFYHYARPETGNSPEAEADYFLSLVGQHAGKCIYALDFEGDAIKWAGDQDQWALRWLKRVKEKTGVKPLLYIQGSPMSNKGWKDVAAADFGLWAASDASWYRNVWPFVVIQQKVYNNLDHDTFNGDLAMWNAYCGKKAAVKTVTIPTEKDGIYRLYDPNSGAHLFTADHKEAQTVASHGWKYEGVAWHQTGKAKIYRLYSGSEHVYVPASDEYANLDLAGWDAETVAFTASLDPGDDLLPVFRLYNKAGGKHMYTIDATERDSLVKAGWTLEGVAFYEHK